MLNLTPFARPYFLFRAKNALNAAMNCKQSQEKIFRQLIASGCKTRYGEQHRFSAINTIDKFRMSVPVIEYPQIRSDVMDMINGKTNILWPGKCNSFAQSSGTSDGKSKYIPITQHCLKNSHYRGSADVVAFYLKNNPQSKLFSGKSFILGGSFANELDIPKNVKVGDLSAHLIQDINPIANLFRVPSKETALLENWQRKLPMLVEESSRQNITNISGVPSWFLTVIKEIISANNAKTIHDIWPNLEVFFHGGISFNPYRSEYNKLTDSSKISYVETYNASEGFFAVADRMGSGEMLLLMDLSTLYEFIPLDQIGDPYPCSLSSWQVKPGEIYALAITSSNGLWRYIIGDTVKIESINPIRITIAGRTKSFINAFGEELMVYNAEAALNRACSETGAVVSDYTVAPLFADNGHRGAHQWLIEFTSTPACGIESFANKLDLYLTQENSDYQAKREGNIFLNRLKIVSLPAGTFNKWLQSTGKLGGQRKVPRLSNDCRIADAILSKIEQ